MASGKVHPPVAMERRTARMTGALIAECPRCSLICAYWDEEDLDEDGNLICTGGRIV